MANIKDITGQRFGMLIALRKTAERRNSRVVWECKCDCGNTAFVPAVYLRSGYTTSCGCMQTLDLTGQRFGQLIAVRPTSERRRGYIVWECKCDCGNTAFVSAINLRRGYTTSCGCAKYRRKGKDLAGQRFGQLVAIRPTDERINKSIVWECKCDCGKTTRVSAANLQSGNTTSCGCARRVTQGVDLTGQRFGQLIAVRPTSERRRGYIVWECKCDCGNTAYMTTHDLRRGSVSCGCVKPEKKAEDITGQRFGKLVAIRPTDERINGNVVWECKCDCGNTKLVPAGSLRSGNTTSCGCIKTGKKFSDLTGQRFGKLVAIRPTDERINGSVVWECKCDCGNTAHVDAGNLRKGHTTSCGCAKAMMRGENLTGQRFGQLVAIRPTDGRISGSVVWECKCDCGNTKFASLNYLRSGHTTSCGCAQTADITGLRFGQLIAVRPTSERRGNSIVWECKCDCGNTAFVSAMNLRRGNATSCGCTKYRKRGKDLTGQRFGWLTAIREIDERKKGHIMWECKCDCGNTKIVRASTLLRGATISCGCARSVKAEGSGEADV